MARAQDQKRWRENTDKQRVEVYLPVETVAALDRLAAFNGQSRANTLSGLIAEANVPAKPTPAIGKPYRLRRPWRHEDRRWDWIVVVDGKPLAGIERLARKSWRGRYLKTSLTWRWAKRGRRGDVALVLVEAPDIYQ